MMTKLLFSCYRWTVQAICLLKKLSADGQYME